MRTNTLTEHFPKIVKDYMVTSFTGQKLDQSFGDQYWEFPDAGALMQVFEAIADVAEDLIKDYEERINNLKAVCEIHQMNNPLPPEVIPPSTAPLVAIPEPPPEPVKEKAKRGRKAGSKNKDKPCVACEGTGKNSKGDTCPICAKVEEPVTGVEVVAPPAVPIPSNTPPWLAPKVEPVVQPAAPAFFPPPPPPPFWNPNA